MKEKTSESTRFRRARAVIEELLSLPDGDWDRRAEQRCGGDLELLADVRRLLAKRDTHHSLLDREGACLVSIHPKPPKPASGDSWQKFIELLRSRGPSHERYLARGEVGRGGMGLVRRVYDQDLRRELALKQMLSARPSCDSARSNASLGRFLEEAQVTSQLDHPGIVPVHELGVDADGHVYFTMKLVKGDNLAWAFERVADPADDEWTQTRALSVLQRACEALAYAHDKGVVHRDLKPGNIMVGRYGETYVMDWGLAKLLGAEDHRDLRIRPTAQTSVLAVQIRHNQDSADATDSPLITMDGDVVGTPAYMPPEQAAGRLAQIGPHSDVYSMGSMIYQLLSGHMPYVPVGSRAHPHAIWCRVQEGPPAPLSEQAPEAPAELVAICEKSMAREIGQRYVSMLDLARDLRAYLEHRVVSAYESGALAELRKWVVRNRGIAATTAAAMVLIASLSTWFVVRIRSERNAALVESARAESRKAEFDQLAGVVLLKDAQMTEQELYPAWPKKIAELERWLAQDAARLLALKPALRQTLHDLEARALPWTAEDRKRDRSTHRLGPELELLTQRIESLRRAQAVREGRQTVPPATPRPEESTLDARQLVDYAWPRVNPDPSQRIFGEEREALVAARAAALRVETVGQPEADSRVWRTLAWALLANGLDAEARQAVQRASAKDARQFDAALATVQGASGQQMLADLETEQAALEAVLFSRRTWRFETESQRFLHATLTDLSQQIADFERNERRKVEQRLAWARRIEELTLHHPNALGLWDEAREAIQAADGVVASELYRQRPLGLKPQWGLIPIGMNPVTKLWEFYHLRSAWDLAGDVDPADLPIPEHQDDGSIEMRDDTGIVFVLIPGGTFWMGAQSTAPDQPNYDPQAALNEAPVRQVSLNAYFLARHELTKGQWFRISGGEEPSWFERNDTYDQDPIEIGWMHPVEYVSWNMCTALLDRHGLALPTEAQWEFAARAGSTSPWWTGSDASSLFGAANVLDLRSASKYPGWGRQEGNFDDGFVAPARVGTFRFNDFGLFDVHGNAWEWCRDRMGPYTLDIQSGDGLRLTYAQVSHLRLNRGGSFNLPAGVARSASRSGSSPNVRYQFLGLRPARTVDP